MFSAMKPMGTDRRGMRRTPRRLIGTLFAAVALLIAVPASAQALSLSGLTAAPASTQAGAHSNFHLHMGFGGGQVKDLTVGLPPGMIGDPNATPLCTVAQLNADSCPANTKVGSVTANATVTAILIPVTTDVQGDLYNLTPQPGEPARFGIVLRPLKNALCPPLPVAVCNLLPTILPPVILQSGVQLRPDFGLNTVIKNIPNKTSGLDTTINSQDITLFGTAPGTGKHFMRNPTSCKQQTTKFTAVPYSGSTATGQASFTTTNCGALDFSPSFTAEVGGPGQTTNGVPTTASTSILQDTDEAGLLNAVVKVPSDLNPNSSIFFGSHCDQASFQAGTCPSNTVVGLATAASPLLSQPLVGNVELVTGSGALPNLGLDLKGQLHLLLQGTVDISAGNTVAFSGLPDIPIARFQLTFTNPPGLLGTARDLCTPPPPLFHADFTGYNGASTAVDSAATVDGCGAGNGGTAAKCKKHKVKKKHKKRAAESKKKHKKKHSCKKKKKHKKHRK
jgi:hypothetical protein